MWKIILRALGEALLQLGMTILLIFLLERAGVFTITIAYQNTDLIWVTEAGSMLGIFLAIALVLTNLMFAFWTKLHWLYRGIAESLTLIPIYTMVSSWMMGLIQFTYDPLWLGILVLLISPLLSNILLNYFVKGV